MVKEQRRDRRFRVPALNLKPGTLAPFYGVKLRGAASAVLQYPEAHDNRIRNTQLQSKTTQLFNLRLGCIRPFFRGLKAPDVTAWGEAPGQRTKIQPFRPESGGTTAFSRRHK